MGRWSRLLAAPFTAFAGLAPGERILDAGCGTGSLLRHLAACDERPEVAGIDASPIYVAAAREAAGPGIRVEEGDICGLPFTDAAFDRAMTQLVLQFIPDPARALAELVRVTRPGGTVAAAVWASGGGMVAQRMFLDTAALLDPAAAALRDHTFTRPMTRPGQLPELFHAGGLGDVAEGSATIWMDFADFSDWWGPIAQGEGTLGKYVASLPERARHPLEAALRAAYQCGAEDGPRSFAATALLCRGRRS